MKTLILFACLFTACFAFEPKDPVWMVVVKTENGTVNLLRNLSLPEAVKVSASFEVHREPGIWYTVSPNDVREHKILGPDDWDGCTKAMHHAFNSTEEVCNGGPNKGLRYRSGSCTICGEHKFEWIDQPKE